MKTYSSCSMYKTRNDSTNFSNKKLQLPIKLIKARVARPFRITVTDDEQSG